MQVETLIARTTQRVLKMRLFQTYPEDVFLTLFSYAGEVLDPLTANATAAVSAFIPSSLATLRRPIHTPRLPFMQPAQVVLQVRVFALTHNLFLFLLSAYMCLALGGEARVWAAGEPGVEVQMTQFCLMMVEVVGVGYAYPSYARASGLWETDFMYPSICGKLSFWYLVSMLCLFLNFYVQDRKRDRIAGEAANKDGVGNTCGVVKTLL
ncbi:hypothetical protein BC830DRAFT_1124454 [Chytriomyces sp. MP71]|nr:hypothetical protein BC830DRAFT_1124454 [Chytriomyces sp. MP71]